MDKVQRINRDYYNSNAERWIEQKTHAFYAEKEFRKFVRYFEKDSVILDVGCGYGRDVPLFLGIGHELKYEGLDLSERFIEIASSRYPQLPFYVGNILEKKTLPTKKYDGVWAAAALQHIPAADWELMLCNLESLLKKEAVCYFTLPEDRPNPASEEDPRHFTLFSDAEMKRILTSRGWSVLEVGELPATRFSSAWRWYICKLPNL